MIELTWDFEVFLYQGLKFKSLRFQFWWVNLAS